MNLELARPWWLLLLPLVALLAWYLRRHVNHANPWRGICDAPLLQFLTQERRTATRSSGPWILGVALLMAILALAGPGRSNQRPAAFRAATVRIVVLDVSRSMNATDLGASRLDLARFKAIDLLERTQDGQSAVILYAGDAFLLAPPSDDSITLSTLLRVVDSSVMPVRGSRLERALTMAGELAARPAVDFAEVVVLTDGASAAAVAAATRLREAGTRVSVIGVGTLAGAPVPSSPRDSSGTTGPWSFRGWTSLRSAQWQPPEAGITFASAAPIATSTV